MNAPARDKKRQGNTYSIPLPKEVRSAIDRKVAANSTDLSAYFQGLVVADLRQAGLLNDSESEEKS